MNTHVLSTRFYNSHFSQLIKYIHQPSFSLYSSPSYFVDAFYSKL